MKQKTFLSAFRDCGFNARKATRQLGGAVSREAHIAWMHNADYASIVAAWRGSAAADALDRDRLLARQDAIVEELLEPKPILYQGEHTGFEENQASSAAKANETLMKAAGILKDKDVDVNIGLIGPEFVIAVMQRDGTVVSTVPQAVPVELPAWDDVP